MSSVLLDPAALLDPTTYQKKEVKSCSLGDTKPRVESYDSGEEFSFAHLVHVHELVEFEDQVLNRYVFDDECLHVA